MIFYEERGVGQVGDFAVGRGLLVPKFCVSHRSKSIVACSLHAHGPGTKSCVSGTAVRSLRRVFTACVHGSRVKGRIICFKPVKYRAKFCLLIHGDEDPGRIFTVAGRILERVCSRGKRMFNGSTVRYKRCRGLSLTTTGTRTTACLTILRRRAGVSFACPRWGELRRRGVRRGQDG